MPAPQVYLVTGGCGFIGSHLTRALVGRGHRVRVLDDLSAGRAAALPAGVELVAADVGDRASVRAAIRGVAGCFHLAAVASVERTCRDWLGGHRTNAGGTVAILEAARDSAGGPVPVVYASSAAVYGDAGDPPLAENRRPAPLSAYGADKLGSELHAGLAQHLFGVPTLGLRFFNVYGPGQSPASPYSGVITTFCDRLSRGQGVTLHGDGRQTRDFVYVADVVAALLAAMGRLPDGGAREPAVVNVSTGRQTSIVELARALAALTGTALRVAHEPARQGDIRHSAGCTKRLAETLGVVASTPLRDGLERTLGWYRHRPAIGAAA